MSSCSGAGGISRARVLTLPSGKGPLLERPLSVPHSRWGSGWGALGLTSFCTPLRARLQGGARGSFHAPTPTGPHPSLSSRGWNGLGALRLPWERVWGFPCPGKACSGLAARVGSGSLSEAPQCLRNAWLPPYASESTASPRGVCSWLPAPALTVKLCSADFQFLPWSTWT